MLSVAMISQPEGLARRFVGSEKNEKTMTIRLDNKSKAMKASLPKPESAVNVLLAKTAKAKNARTTEVARAVVADPQVAQWLTKMKSSGPTSRASDLGALHNLETAALGRIAAKNSNMSKTAAAMNTAFKRNSELLTSVAGTGLTTK